MASSGRLLAAPVPLPLLDEEVDRDRHHRPDAGHHQREQPAQGRGEQERNQALLGLLRDLAEGLRWSRARCKRTSRRGRWCVRVGVRCSLGRRIFRAPPAPLRHRRRQRSSAPQPAASTGRECCRSWRRTPCSPPGNATHASPAARSPARADGCSRSPRLRNTRPRRGRESWGPCVSRVLATQSNPRRSSIRPYRRSRTRC